MEHEGTQLALKHFMEPAKANEKLVQDCYNAFNSREYKKIEDLIGQDAEFTFVPFRQVFRGKEQVIKAFEDWTKSFPDMKLQVTNLIVGEEGGVAELLGRGTHQGVLKTPEGDISPTGKQVEIEGCEVFKIKDGKFISVRSYFDTGSLARQLGIKATPVAA